ncbi:hypothetical protein ACTFIZ_011845 [Dictyostelium cf. discoideum]
MSGNIYMDIIASQVSQGNLGGKNGQFGYLAKDKSRREKKLSKEKIETPKKKVDEKFECQVLIGSGTVAEATDSNGLSDPFVIIWSVDDEGQPDKSLFKSKVCKKTLTPKWDEKGSLKLKSTYKSLIVELWDHDLLSANDFIGRAKINVDSDGLKKYSYASFKDTISLYDGEKSTPSGTVYIEITNPNLSKAYSSCI